MKKLLDKIRCYPLFFWSLVLLAISIPYSKTAISISEGLLILAWILEGNFREKFNTFKKRSSIFYLITIFLVHLLGLIYTSNFNYAFHDLRIKLPLLILPFLIGTHQQLSKNQLKIFFNFFCLAVIVNTLISLAVLIGYIPKPISDPRQISLWCSHIRFALLINISIFYLFYLILNEEFKYQKLNLLFIIILIIWQFVFLFLLKSFTGIFIVTFGLIIFVFFLIRKLSNKRKWFIPISICICLFIFIPFYYLSIQVNNFYNIEKIDFQRLEALTINKNPYQHDTTSKLLENGRYIYLYICNEEISKEWSKRSKFELNHVGKDKKEIKQTLFRYLTAKGLRKDSLGISKLSNSDIQNIENGISNPLYINHNHFDAQIYTVIWQIDCYLKTGNPNGQSISQRIEFAKNALSVFRENFWFGVGTGDIQDKIINEYNVRRSKLSKEYYLHPHNQYISFLVSFGIFGFLFIILGLILAAVKENKTRNFLYITTSLTVFLSMLNEDTLETQVGVTLFALFYTISIYSDSNIRKINNYETHNKISV